MCETCNGTHVVHADLGYGYKIDTCPVCGPMDDAAYQKRMDFLFKRLEEAELKNSLNGVRNVG